MFAQRLEAPPDARVNHMHLADAQRAIQRFAQTGARYLLTNVRREGGGRTSENRLK